ncbi:hypothetical protein ACFYTS_27480 [Nocardia sp. NPDC004151]|uniref:hypothetical protein n=1 Tax=Nocardia sp. NPDC004151 TaxID=3364304 RepID=UPI00368A335C
MTSFSDGNEAGEKAPGAAQNLGDTVQEAFKGGAEDAREWVEKAGDEVKEWAEKAGDEVKEWAGGLTDKVKGMFDRGSK